MKKSKRTLLALTAFAGGSLGVLSKSKSLKAVGFGTAGVSLGILLRDIFKEEKKLVEVQCEKTEQILQKSGITISALSEIENSSEDGDEDMSETLFISSVNDLKFDNEMLLVPGNDFLGTIHFFHDMEKNQVKFAIPLPRQINRKTVSPRDVREYFVDLLEEFIETQELDINLNYKKSEEASTEGKVNCYPDQIGYLVERDSETGCLVFREIDRDRKVESFDDYLVRVNTAIDCVYNKDQEFFDKIKPVLNEGNTLERAEQYLIFRFPATNKRGFNALSSMLLLEELMNYNHEVDIKSTGAVHTITFNHIAFHVEGCEDLVYQRGADGKIETVGIK